MLNHAAVFDVAVELDELFSSPEVVFRLGDGTGAYTDMEWCIRCKCRYRKSERKNQNQCSKN